MDCPIRWARDVRKGVAGALVGVVLAVVVPTPEASAAWFHIEAETVGDAYQLVTSDDELLNRRRISQYLAFGAYDLLGDGSHSLSFQSMFRFEAAFGLTDDTVARLQGFDRYGLSIQTAFLQGRDLGDGWVDFKVGRQLVVDPIDFMMLDGAVVTVKTPWFFGVELLGGIEAKHDMGPVTISNFELDGIRKLGDGDPANDAATVAVGAALVTTNSDDYRARIGYRRLFSEGEVDQEKVGGAFYMNVSDVLHLNLSWSLDLIKLIVDQANVHVRGRITDAWEVEGQYVRIDPIFDADSIFNVFSTRPLNDGNLRARFHISDSQLVYAGGMARFFEADDYTHPAGEETGDPLVEAWGAMAGYRQHWGRQGRVYADVSWEDGYGGRRVLGDLGGTWGIVPGQWELDARATVVYFDDALQPNLYGVSGGYQLGARYRIDTRAAITLMVEQNFNRIHTTQLRAFALVDLDFFVGTGGE